MVSNVVQANLKKVRAEDYRRIAYSPGKTETCPRLKIQKERRDVTFSSPIHHRKK